MKYKKKSRRLTCACIALSLAASAASAEAGDPAEVAFGGHAKYQLIRQSYPSDSIFRDYLGASSTDQYLETRLKLAADRSGWDFKADYQFIAIRADTLSLADRLPGSALPINSVISDDRRWWDLTYRSGDSGRTAFVHRLDRLSVGFSTERTVWRFGRQAISWGNGLMFTPMDVFNPFDPAAVDKEYKSGDDMLYGQFLFEHGGDLQAVAVVRRDPLSGEVEREASSLAAKYHGFLGDNGFDVLAAEHYDDTILGVGGDFNLGGAILRGDLTWTRTRLDEVLSAVASASYSWTWGGRNVTGLLEYYYNGFGQAGGAYTLIELARNPDLRDRLERGELYTLGRHYLGASATIELTPLLRLVPNLFLNLDDPSALAQLVTQFDFRQEWLLLCALNVPVGPSGTEYGGIATQASDRYFSTGPSFFAELAWYF